MPRALLYTLMIFEPTRCMHPNAKNQRVRCAWAEQARSAELSSFVSQQEASTSGLGSGQWGTAVTCCGARRWKAPAG